MAAPPLAPPISVCSVGAARGGWAFPLRLWPTRLPMGLCSFLELQNKGFSVKQDIVGFSFLLFRSPSLCVRTYLYWPVWGIGPVVLVFQLGEVSHAARRQSCRREMIYSRVTGMLLHMANEKETIVTHTGMSVCQPAGLKGLHMSKLSVNQPEKLRWYWNMYFWMKNVLFPITITIINFSFGLYISSCTLGRLPALPSHDPTTCQTSWKCSCSMLRHHTPPPPPTPCTHSVCHSQWNGWCLLADLVSTDVMIS